MAVRKNEIEKVIRKRVVFSLEAPRAQNVSLVGTFNNWDSIKHKMKKDSDGLWTKAVIVPRGNHEYKFIVDGEWWQDPENKNVVTNEHGTLNSLITVQ